MLFEDKVQKLTTEEEFNKLQYEYNDDNKIYPYYFIIIKYEENNEIKELKIDQIKDLVKLKDMKILYKYYIKKLHYLSDPQEFYAVDDGEAYHIYNVGYFYIDGYFDQDEDELNTIKELYKKYNDNFSNMKFPFTDEEFLLNNKSVNLF